MKKASILFSAISFLAALSALLLWITDRWEIISFGKDYIPMAPSTAILMMLFALSLIMNEIKPYSPVSRLLSLSTCGITSFSALFVLFRHLHGFGPYEKLLGLSNAEKVFGIPVGIMSPLTALIFLLCCVSMAAGLPWLKKNRLIFKIILMMAPIPALLAVMAGTSVILGYAAGVPLLYDKNTVPMAMLTGFCFVLTGVCIVFSTGKNSWLISGPDQSLGKADVSRWPLIFFITATLSIAASGAVLIKKMVNESHRKLTDELLTISDLKAGQIERWQKERMGDASVIFKSRLLRSRISDFLEGRSNEKEIKELLEWMEALKKTSVYHQVAIFDASGNPRLWTPAEGPVSPEHTDEEKFKEALQTKKISINDLHMHSRKEVGEPRIFMGIYIPIVSDKESTELAEGILMLRIDPYNFLFPLIQSWPVQSKTSETLIIRKDGDSVLFLNELRHKKNTALRFRLPMRQDLPAAMAVSGQKGIVEGLDYRQERVVAAIKEINGTDWFMVAKTDHNEIFGPLAAKAWGGIGIIMGLMTCVFLGYLMFEKQRKIATLKDALEREQENKLMHDALMESEKHFRNIFDQAAVGISYLDLGGRFVKVNSKFCEISGYPEEDLLRMTFKDITHPDDLSGDLFNVRRLLDGTVKTYSMEKRYIRRNGDIQWINLTVSLDLFADGRPRSFISVVEDIADRKRAENALKESQKRYSATIDALNDGLWEWQIPSGEAFFSRHYYNMLGYEESDFPASYDAWRRLVNPEDLGKAEKYLNGSIPTEKGFDIDLRMKTKKGEWKWTAVRGRVIETGPDGLARKMIGTLSDITERKNSENQIIAEKERLHVTLRSIGDGVITTDTECRITLMNRIAENLTGWKLREAQGQKLEEVFQIFGYSDKKTCPNPAIRVMETGEIIELENNTVLRNKNGTERIIEDSAAPIRDSLSKIIGVVIVFRDMTEKHKTEEALQNAQRLESLSILAGGIAHDFNNLLGGIFGYLDMALESIEDRDSEGAKSNVSGALSVFERARDLTRQLLTFSKGGEPARKIQPIPELIKESVTFALTGSSISVSFDIPDGIWMSYFDKYQIGQVIDNITINARQAMPQGGKIEIRISNVPSNMAPPMLRPKDYVKISIADNGPGIQKEIISHIFDPFFTTKQYGNGLGLATCYSIIKRHDGMIDVESEQDMGTIFTIYLPASSGQTDTIHEESALKVRGGAKKILVMDDEVPLINVTSAMLVRLGYVPFPACDGDEALEMIRQAQETRDPFSVAILDLTIPGGRGGKDITGEIKEIDPGIRLVASSGYSGDSVMSNPTEFGFSACITKPFRLTELSNLLSGLEL